MVLGGILVIARADAWWDRAIIATVTGSGRTARAWAGSSSFAAHVAVGAHLARDPGQPSCGLLAFIQIRVRGGRDSR
jgi:hypothetical protein